MIATKSQPKQLDKLIRRKLRNRTITWDCDQ